MQPINLTQVRLASNPLTTGPGHLCPIHVSSIKSPEFTVLLPQKTLRQQSQASRPSRGGEGELILNFSESRGAEYPVWVFALCPQYENDSCLKQVGTYFLLPSAEPPRHLQGSSETP